MRHVHHCGYRRASTLGLVIEPMADDSDGEGGGRGSTKSSFISMVIVLLIIADSKAKAAVVVRQFSSKPSDSFYQQIQWVIEVLGCARS